MGQKALTFSIEGGFVTSLAREWHLSIHYLAVFFNIKPKKTPVIGVGTPSDKNTLARKFSRQNLRTMKQVRAYIKAEKKRRNE